MKFSCTKENLNNGLSVVGHISTRGGSLPILNNILLKTVSGSLELTATNLEMAITTIVRGRVEGEGALTIQSRLLTEAAALLPDEKVQLSVADNALTITCGNNRTVIKGMAAEEFPVIPQFNKGDKISLGSEKLGEALSQVVFAVNSEDSRPEIAGVFMGNNKEGVVLVGTDSYRLAETKLEITGDLVEGNGAIIPLRTAQEVSRISQNSATTETQIYWGDNQILWQIGDTQIISRLVAGQYPDYLQIIPKEFNTKLLVDRDVLQKAVKAASLFVRSGINDVRLKIDDPKKSLLVSSTNSQLGENDTEIKIGLEGPGVEIIFNYRYLLDGLAAIPDKEVKIKIVGANQPSLFEPNKSEGYRYLIMPIRQ